jgi:thiol-disulfide isomerase/thioredoxin
MQRRSRRAFLAGVAATTAGSLAGCTGALRGGGSTPSGMTVETLSVGGSSSDTVPVQPAGTVTLLDFFATWCAPCKPQMDHLGTVRDRFPQLHMLSITWEKDPEVVKSFWTEYEGTWPVALDPEVRTGPEYGVDRIPTMVVLDAEGEEVWRHSGLAATDSIVEQVESARSA